ncbi:hypothetical protein ACFTY8_03275 [Streptomyces mirabilis]|uniref:hypothetical protein n=1 Tax=Streptomyces mirabilis TaxID=68239 RepID=UPI00362CF7CA
MLMSIAAGRTVRMDGMGWQQLKVRAARARLRADLLEQAADGYGSPWCKACRYLRDAAADLDEEAADRRREENTPNPHTGLLPGYSNLANVNLSRAARYAPTGTSRPGYVRLRPVLRHNVR